MKYFSFSTDNRNPFVLDRQDQINFCFHINTFAFPLMHGHLDYWEFTIVTKGSLIHKVNGKEVLVEAGQTFHASPSDTHGLFLADKSKKNVRYVNLIGRTENVNFLLSLFPEKFQASIRNGTNVHRLTPEAIIEIEATVKKTLFLKNDELETYNALISSALLILLSSLYKNSVFENDASDFTRRLEELKGAPDFLQLSAEQLCERLGQSRSQVHRYMKKHFGVSTHEFLNSYRMRYAESLLLTSDLSIERIALDSGFSGLPIFYTNFKKTYGVPPALYRKEYKSE